MLRRGEHLRRWTNFGDTASIEDEDAICKTSEQSRIMGYQDHREAELLLEAPEELQDFLLRRGVEGCGRFIGNDEGRPTGDRLCDDNPLTLASAQFMRIGVGNTFGIDGENRCEKLTGFFTENVSIQSFVRGQDIANLPAYWHGWMERGGRLLKDQAQATAADSAEVFARSLKQIFSLETD